MRAHVLGASSTLVGMTIGAGILGVPFVVAQSGFLIGTSMIVVLGLVILFLNLYTGEITLRAKGNHQLTGLTELFLGKKARRVMEFAFLFGLNAALIAYIIGGGEVLHELFNIPAFLGSLLFFALFSVVVYTGMKYVERLEVLFVACIAMAIGLLFFLSIFSGKIVTANLTKIYWEHTLLPYGVILFAFLGMPAVPEMKEVLKHNLKSMRQAIINGTLFCMLAYILFAFSVVGITGDATTQVATTGLGQVFGMSVLIIANLFSFLTLATSFVSVGYALEEAFRFDYYLKKVPAFLLAVMIPLIMFLAGAKNFIHIIGIAGAVSGGIIGMLVVLMHSKAKKNGQRKPEFSIKSSSVIHALLIVVLLLGLLSELLL